jgi:hypothetical protein
MTRSPRTSSASRLVAKITAFGHRSKMVSASAAAGSTRCSQLSSITRMRRTPKNLAIPFAKSAPGAGR